jgi:hypothetical protein
MGGDNLLYQQNTRSTTNAATQPWQEQDTCESSRRVLFAFHLGAAVANCGCLAPNMTSTKASPGSFSVPVLPQGLARTDSVSCSRL